MKILSKIQEDIDFNFDKDYLRPRQDNLSMDVFNLKNSTSSIKGCVVENGTLIDLKISHGIHTKLSQTIAIGETALVINIPFSNNYGHCLHDTLPKLLWADKNSKYDKIYTSGNPMIESLVDLFDIQFKKTIFVNQDFAIHSENVILENHRALHIREKKKNKILKEIIDEKSSKLKTCPKKLLIYCSRNHSGDVQHGRLMNQNNEDTIIKLLQEYCHDNDLMFHLFSGQENGKTMSHKKQFELFRCAKIVVGPHGSAMANILYLDFKNKPKICEFTSGTQTQVHAKSTFGKHYYALHGYIFDDNQYYLIPFTKDSTPEVTSIDIDNLKDFLSIVKNDKS